MDTKTTTDGYTTPNGVFSGQAPINYPKTTGYTPAEPTPVGGVILADGDIDYNTDRRTVTIKVRNTGDRPIQIGSHFHFFEVNRYLEFDRHQAYGMHLDIPATTAVRFEPGEEKEIGLVEFGGKRRVIGFNNLVDGYTGFEDTPSFYPKKIEAFDLIEKYGFKNVTEEEADAEFTSQPAPKATDNK